MLHKLVVTLLLLSLCSIYLFSDPCVFLIKTGINSGDTHSPIFRGIEVANKDQVRVKLPVNWKRPELTTT